MYQSHLNYKIEHLYIIICILKSLMGLVKEINNLIYKKMTYFNNFLK